MNRRKRHLHGRVGQWVRLLTLSLLVFPLGVGSASAQGLGDSGLRDDAPDSYTVVRGDTLWDISGRFLRHPWQWPRIWGVNPQIDNPHLIYPGDSVYLYYENGQPRLGLERGQGEVRLSPDVRRVPRREAVPPLPLERVQHFLSDHRVVDESTLATQLPYVLAGDDRRLVSGAGDRIYARGELAAQGRWGIYRPGEAYHDSVTGEFLGQEMAGVGQARWISQEEDIALLEVVASRQEVRDGDVLLPLETFTLPVAFQPAPPTRFVDGRILAVPGGVRFIGRLHVVALDRGSRDGLGPGHVLRVEQRGELVTDPVTQEAVRLPGSPAGLVMVFRAYDKMSYALVMQASRSLSVGDRAHSPDIPDIESDRVALPATPESLR
ncbi:LysM peptidoglycan-binding domain-containing protein [Litchfieldella xinjiangensis]|uniref:LysM peptidoglycan-binding domain-containing protein n=1 Tax=Litchfieldella xinjiangensis TaxID=1166948 RepID=UPI00069446CB|nr:LysM peptidoglycan-binding domain-containing protein [Halomonas xinjiangensis]